MTSAPPLRRLAALALAGVLTLASGCATTGTGNADSGHVRDPLENWNRKVYAFNDGLDKAVLKPVATAYKNVVPSFVRTGVSNVFGNFSDAWSGVNNLLQGKLEGTLRDFFRVTTNSTLGLLGLLDVASEIGLERQGEDLGQTFGRWGFGPGPYIVWPLLGPSTLRDSIALPFDRYVTPATWVSPASAQLATSGLQLVSVRAGLLGATQLLDDIALDKYTFIRDAYLQRRRSLVYDGNEPAEPEEAEPPAPAASSTDK